MIGGFFDAQSETWNDTEINWFEEFLEEQDVDIMAWALGTIAVPAHWQCAMMDRFAKLDYLSLSA